MHHTVQQQSKLASHLAFIHSTDHCGISKTSHCDGPEVLDSLLPVAAARSGL